MVCDMKTKYAYRGVSNIKVVVSQITGLFCIAIFTPLSGILLYGVTKVDPPPNTQLLNDPRVTLIILSIGAFLFTFSMGLLFINFYPTIWVEENGLEISFLVFFRIGLPWKMITGIGSENHWGLTLIKAKRITPFHIFYGWYFNLSPHPGFLIHKSIEDKENLLREIKLHYYELAR